MAIGKDIFTRPNRPELDAIKVPTVTDIAWSAGIYEGEGTCRVCGKGKRGLAIAVVQKDPEILLRLRDWFGGSINTNKAPSRTTCHVWDACGDRARLFLALVYPYLSARRKVQVDLTQGLEFLSGRSPEGLTLEELKDQLRIFYERHKEELRNKDLDRKRAKYAERKLHAVG